MLAFQYPGVSAWVTDAVTAEDELLAGEPATTERNTHHATSLSTSGYLHAAKLRETWMPNLARVARFS
ncbi:hypothetical protein WR43_22400 [Mycolicibacter arupensis]|jgi:hypothetical protein|uniref:Uncharacterized protein n=1 Tax=Mycolicibacter arupensis TaxID=342002 RepID=A0A0M2WFY1_9MYCO|nr:hypothetical protein WR43_22400 [Mycolicibacter arupensis]